MNKREKMIVKTIVLFLAVLITFTVAFEPILMEWLCEEAGAFDRIIHSYVFPPWAYAFIAMLAGFFIRWLYESLQSMDKYDVEQLGQKEKI